MAGGNVLPHSARAGDDIPFVQETRPNARNITGYYLLSPQISRGLDDGYELQMHRGPLGELIVRRKDVSPETQRRALGPGGRLNLRQIIVGRPPFPELEGERVVFGEPPAWGKVAVEPLDAPPAHEPLSTQHEKSTVYLGLGTSFTITYTSQ